MAIFCNHYMPKFKTKLHLNKNNGVKISKKHPKQSNGNQNFTTKINR
jgi:hypothetical protein